MNKPEQILESDTLIYCWCGKREACVFTKRVTIHGNELVFIPGGYDDEICLKEQTIFFEKPTHKETP